MKKILFVIGQLGVGGAENQLIYLASHLSPKKYQVLVATLSTDAPLRSRLVDAGIEIVIIPQVMRPDLIRPFKLYRLAKSYQADIIHSYLSVANTWSRIVGAVLHIPVILSERNSEPYIKIHMRVVNRLLATLGNCLIANSNSGACKVVKNKEFKPEKVHVVYNGVPFESFQAVINDQKKNELRTELGIPKDKQVIGIIARLNYEKNHELLFESYQILRKQLPDSCILCIGDGPRRGELQSIAQELGIEDAVIFAGIRKDIPECLAIMDVLVLPSRWEGLPNVILEAMAARCPVVATDVGGVGEIVIDGITGFLVKPEDKFDLVEKISTALSDKYLVSRIKEEAMKFVYDNFSIDRMVMETVRIYDQVLQGD